MVHLLDRGSTSNDQKKILRICTMGKLWVLFRLALSVLHGNHLLLQLLLGKLGNSEKIPGVLKQVDTAGNSGNRVSWSDMVQMNL